MYSTVGVRVPIWRRTILLNKCTTSFFPCKNQPLVIRRHLLPRQPAHTTHFALGVAIPIITNHLIKHCTKESITFPNHQHRWKLSSLTSKSIRCRFAMRAMRRLVLYNSWASWATASVWGSLSPVPHSTSFREDRFFETSSATWWQENTVGELTLKQDLTSRNHSRYSDWHLNTHLFTLFALCGVQFLHVRHILFQVFHYLSGTLLRLSEGKRHDGGLLCFLTCGIKRRESAWSVKNNPNHAYSLYETWDKSCITGLRQNPS